MFLGLELNKIRTAMGVPQSAVSNGSEVSVATVQRVLSGKNCSAGTLIRVADALGYNLILQRRILNENAPTTYS